MTTIKNYINAAYPILAVNTCEPDRAQQEIYEGLKGNGHQCYSWDISGKITNLSNNDTNTTPGGPMAPINWLSHDAEDNTVLFAWNMHRFLASIEVVQAIQNGRDIWKSRGQTLIILSPDITLPPEIEKSVQIIDFTLPDKAALAKILESICKDAACEYPEDADDILQIALGLPAFQAESAFALALSSTGLKSFSRKIIIDQKAQIVKKNASLEISHYKETFDDIGGLGNLKEFCSKTISSKLAMGVLLLGVPGTGKSMFAKALGNHAGLPVLSLDFGRLFGSLVGSSEQKTRDALAVVSAMRPVILFCDELERGLSGMNGSGGDNGVGSRVLGSFLTWMNDKPSQVYVIATANNISNLPAELLRAERWDALFYVDLPVEEERNTILEMYKKQFGVEGEAPDLTGHSGAEIKSLCRISSMMSCTLLEASKYVIPLSKSMGDEIKKQREWAKGRCIQASAITEKKSKKTRSISQKKQGGGTFISSN